MTGQQQTLYTSDSVSLLLMALLDGMGCACFNSFDNKLSCAS